MPQMSTGSPQRRGPDPDAPRRGVLGRVAPAFGATCLTALVITASGAATAPVGTVRITSSGGAVHRGQFVPLSATDPAGWFCQITTSDGHDTSTITGIVATPNGVLQSGWLVPRATRARDWSVRVACGPSREVGGLGQTRIASQRRVVLAPVPASEVSAGLVDIVAPLASQSGSYAAGTGIVIGSSGLVLTNNHVIAGSTGISATDLGNHRRYGARVLGIDLIGDLAVLKLGGAHGLRRVPFGNSALAVRGSGVSAVGNVGGHGGAPTITTGIITAVNQSVEATDGASNSVEHLSGLLETNALLRPGDSGGPLVDATGSVVGIATAAATVGSSDPAGFAIPFTPALATAEAIIAGTRRPGIALGSQAYAGYLGVQVGGGTPRGARIVQVEHGSPAERAGLRANETITAINTAPTAAPGVASRAIATTGQLTALLGRLHPGMQVAVTVTGPGAPTTPVRVTLGRGAAR